MVVNPTPVYNSANLALLMVNLSHALIRPRREVCSKFSVNDLKAHFQGRKYVLDTLKWRPQMPQPIKIINRVSKLGQINHIVSAA
jgi:hypothetical protein